jgi:hypothetical protein
MRPILPVLLLAGLAVATACSSDSPAPSSGGAAGTTPGAAANLDIPAYCLAAKQLHDAAARGAKGGDYLNDAVVAITKISQTAPPDIRAAYGRVLLTPGDKSGAKQQIDAYDAANCPGLTPGSI